MQLYDTGRKAQNQHLFDFKNLSDEELMIDFKLSLKDDKDKQLFNMLSQARKPEEIGSREKKGAELDTMPYFLTDQYAAILKEQDKNEKLNKESTGNAQQSSSGAYKSRFLKDKITQQNESRKGQKKGPKGAVAGGEKQTGGKQTRQKGESEEQLIEIIEDLRNDLKVRDLEYEQVRNRLEKLEAQNTFLAEKLKDEKQQRQTIEAKLNKITYMKELDANFAAISNNSFFGAKSKSTYNASQQTKLIDSVNEQYKSSLKSSAAAKCAHIWLEKVRRRRQENQSNGLFNKL